MKNKVNNSENSYINSPLNGQKGLYYELLQYLDLNFPTSIFIQILHLFNDQVN
jgi:hypothetical protein